MSVKAMIQACKRCALRSTCNAPVPIDGPVPANLLVVGEAPGADEDEQGLPFVGAAGRLMRGLLHEAGFRLTREVAWCNVVSCRPPDNRTPFPDEVEACEVNLRAQLLIANPRVVMLAGKTAMQAVRPDFDKVTTYRGTWLWLDSGQVAVTTYHPAACLRKPKWREDLLRDCKIARGIVKGTLGPGDWPGECAVCGLEVTAYDAMGVPFCKWHERLTSRILEARPMQQRLLV